MNKTAFAVVLALAAPAGAQEYRQAQAKAAEESYQALQAQTESFRAAQAKAVGPRVLDATLTAMNDGVEAGGRVMSLLAEKKIEVYLASQDEAVKRGTVNGRDAILLSDKLPAHPRVYAPLIASEAVKLMYADMPACAERSYMRMATAARVFAELGGDFNALPLVDGDRADAVKAVVAPWADGTETALDAMGKADSLPSILDLEAKNQDPKIAAALEAANARFTAFLMDEQAARKEALAR